MKWGCEPHAGARTSYRAVAMSELGAGTTESACESGFVPSITTSSPCSRVQHRAQIAGAG
jgi:hypothetical protein